MSVNRKTSRKEVDSVSCRVKKTKEEIEQLKNELEQLIQSGAKSSLPKPAPEKKAPEVTSQVDLSPQSKKNAPSTEKKIELAKTEKKSPGKKNRNYNVVEAREYIKKQKEKRAEQLKTQLTVADTKVDLKKQKLKELHQKTLELVTKNVQLKRERSKSRNREPPVRPDRSNCHKSRDTIPKSRQNVFSKSQDRLKPVVTNARGWSQERAKSQERVKFDERVSRSRTRQKIDPNFLHPSSNVRSNAKTVKIDVEKTAVPPPDDLIDLNKNQTDKDKDSPQKIDPNFLHPPPNIRRNPKNLKIDLDKTVFPPSDDLVDLNRKLSDRLASRSFDEASASSNKSQKPQKQTSVLERSIKPDACLKDTKETQTNRNSFEGVDWMQPVSTLPYPYNFINSIKRKLQSAINSPKSCVDVGVQNTPSPTPDSKSKEEIREMLIKSAGDLRSFVSHRGPNLDLKVVENLELKPHTGINKETVSKNLFSGYDSESDTSKNIPEISSESVGTLNSKPKLKLDKVRDLKLQKIPKLTIKTDTNGVDSYSSDFQRESGAQSSTIQTVASLRKFSDLNRSSVDQHSIKKSVKENYKHPEVENHDTFIKRGTRGVSEASIDSSMYSTNKNEGDDSSSSILSEVNTSKGSRSEESQGSFKSLLTESQLSRGSSGSQPDKDLKEPSVSLVFKTNGKDVDVRKNLMNTITIRSSTADSNLVDGGDFDENSLNTVTIWSNISDRDLNDRKNSINTVTIRSSDSNFKVKGAIDSQKTVKSKSNSTVESIPESVDDSGKSKEYLKLQEPRVSLAVGKEREAVKSQLKNITLRPSASNNNVNEIHLKFEAEVRLLNDFNESFKQFIAVEKAFENLKSKNEPNLAMTKILQNVDTQTSVITKTSTNVTTPLENKNSINYSRGSEILEELDDSMMNNTRNSLKSLQNSLLSTDWNLSNLNESSMTNISMAEEGKSNLLSNIENCNAKNCASVLSLNIFDQLIKDEDTRIQQLKAIIKIREQALLDRTKSELVYLQFQRKQLIETGKIEQASLLKKKQRGIILKHEQERNEIKKLKQMQKEASEHRKNTLKEQRNFIKIQLSTENMLSKITVTKQRRERRSMGPLRVVQSSEQSETSISLKSSGIEDVLSVTSKSLRVSEESELDFLKEEPVSNARRTLLMREAALQKRRKAAEELLRWHRKLLEEERKIGELEAAATSVVRDPHRHTFIGKQLNQLWRNMTASGDKEKASMNKSTKQHSKRAQARHAPTEPTDARKSVDDVSYSSAFEPDSVQEIISQEEKTKISSISELIDNFSRIEDEISILSRKSEDIVSLKEDQSPRKTSSYIEDEEIVTKNDPVFDKIDLKPSSEISTIEDQDKITDEEVPNEENLEEPEVSATVEEHISPLKEETEVSTETSTDQRSSVVKEDLEEPEVSMTIEQKVTSDGQVSSIVEEESVDRISTEDQKTTDEQIPSPKSDLLNEDQKSPDEEISTHHGEDLEESKRVEVIGGQDQVSRISEDLGTLKSLDDLSSTQYEHILPIEAKIEEEEEQTTEQISTKEESEGSTKDEEPVEVEDKDVISEDISRKNEESEKLELPPATKDEESEKAEVETSEDISPSREDRTSTIEEEVSSRYKEESVDIAKSLSLEEALESASKIEESLSKLNEKFLSEKKNEEISEEVSIGEGSPTTSTDEKTPEKKTIDVKKRVSEILADASLSRGDKSPRLQDLYVTAYDVGTPVSGESNESLEDGRQMPTDIFGSEAEELWRKQLAIEQEIKQIELQQKEQLPYLYMREIPNKPPPPYTPPSSLSSLPLTILPSDAKEVSEIVSYSSRVLHKAFQNDTLEKVKFSENGFKLFSKIEVTKMCAEFVFNICKDIARSHYRQFEEVEEPSWLVLVKRPQLAKTKPADADGLEKILNQKLKELFGFKKARVVESAIVKWGRKKRDHVDEVLVIESQEEESQWTNFDKDELIVKNQVAEDIMKMLLGETAGVFAKIVKKRCV